jgi:parallel beta-helix repeat protein
MSRRILTVLALVVSGTLLQAQGALAKTVVVFNGSIPGATNCRPDIAGTPFTTIQAALDSLTTGTNTVLVCPGIYPEQIVIARNITITGVVDAAGNSNSSEVKIIPPPTGLVSNLIAASGNVAAQVAAQNVADLNLTNLTIDGTNGGCPAGVAHTAGIALYNVGVVGTNSRATVSKTAVKNQIAKQADGTRCFLGEGILLENSWFTLDSNSIHGVDEGGIHQFGGIGKSTNNSLGLGFIGIWLTNVSDVYNTVGSTVSGNNLQAFSTGIYLDGSSSVLVTANTLTNWTGDGIALTRGAADNTVTSNKIVDSNHAIYLNGGGAFGPSPTRNVVKSNTIIRPVLSGIALGYPDGTNQFTLNTFEEGPVGIFVAYLGAFPADVMTPNTFLGVPVMTAVGSYVP